MHWKLWFFFRQVKTAFGLDKVKNGHFLGHLLALKKMLFGRFILKGTEKKSYLA